MANTIKKLGGGALYQHKLNACARMVKALLDQNLTEQEKMDIAPAVSELIRKAHDVATSLYGSGKYLGHSNWSKAAVNVVLKHRKLARRSKDIQVLHGLPAKAVCELSHEHVVPLNVVSREILLNLPKGTSLNTIASKIKEFALVAIITKPENNNLSRNMPVNWDGATVWDRYEEIGLIKHIGPPTRLI